MKPPGAEMHLWEMIGRKNIGVVLFGALFCVNYFQVLFLNATHIALNQQFWTLERHSGGRRETRNQTPSVPNQISNRSKYE